MKHLFLLFIPLLPLAAAEQDLSGQLRDALYTEEVTRDPAAAAEIYVKILDRFDSQRPVAASALFRLAEVRRKQGSKDLAIAHYRDLLQQFPEFEAEIKLARKHLASLGAIPEKADLPQDDADEGHLKRLKKLARTSPDKVLDPAVLNEHLYEGYQKTIKYLVEEIENPGDDKTLGIAAQSGNLTICTYLLEHFEPSPEAAGNALAMALGNQHHVILEFLLDSGLDPNAPIASTNGYISSPLITAVRGGDQKAVSHLLEKGADIDFMVQSSGYPYTNDPIGTALHSAVIRGDAELVRLLLEKGAKPDLPTPNAGITPLHLAARTKGAQGVAILNLFLAKEIDVNRKTLQNIDRDRSKGSYRRPSPRVPSRPLRHSFHPVHVQVGTSRAHCFSRKCRLSGPCRPACHQPLLSPLGRSQSPGGEGRLSSLPARSSSGPPRLDPQASTPYREPAVVFFGPRFGPEGHLRPMDRAGHRSLPRGPIA